MARFVNKRVGGVVGAQPVWGRLSCSARKGFGPDAGRDVNFEWPLWLKLSTPSFLLPKPPGCLCMTSFPNYAPHTHVNLSCHNQQLPPPLNCTALANPYVSPLHPPFLPHFFYHQSPPFFFFFNPQKGIV